MENGTSVKCSKCDKVIPITRELKPTDDAVTCVYCNNVIPTEDITWEDGTFHFNIVGDVTAIPLEFGARKLMQNQQAKILDIRKILAQAKREINEQPNINCICGEFAIKDSDIRLELLLEENEE
jgi:hypothetical protein